EVELAVRPEGEVLPAVRDVARQRIVDDLHRRRIVEVVLDTHHLRDARDLGDVERTVLEGDTVGQVETLRDRLDLTVTALVEHGVDVAGHAAADEQRALVAPRHHARVVDTVRPERSLEAWRDLELVDGNLTRWRGGRRLGDRRQGRVRHARRLTLLPG